MTAATPSTLSLLHPPPPSPHDGRIGGDAGAAQLVAAFFRAMHARDLRPVAARLALFPREWLGGPKDYPARHVHPRPQQRHAAFAIDRTAHDAWLACMAIAQIPAMTVTAPSTLPLLQPPPSPHDGRIGDDAGIARLVAAFYRRMDARPDERAIRAMHARDLQPVAARLALFPREWPGAPKDYSARHDHPRPRQRHAAFPIDRTARDAWLARMAIARIPAITTADPSTLPLLRPPPSPHYGRIGDDAGVARLVAAFYRRMDARPDARAIRAMHTRDLRPATARLTRFPREWLGGPKDYPARHGHPRPRQRHAAFVIDRAARDAWLACMRAALKDIGAPRDRQDALMAAFSKTADWLRDMPDG